MALFSRVFKTGTSLEDWTGLPAPEITQWDSRSKDIRTWWEWFDGTKLAAVDPTANSDKDGNRPLLYPLQINPISAAARLHSFALWGEVPDTSDAPVRILLEDPNKPKPMPVPMATTKPDGTPGPTPMPEPECDGPCDEAEAVLSDVLYENNARAALVEAGLMAQSLGGIVFQLGWDKTALTERPHRIRLEHHDPQYFHCHWTGRDYWHLDRAWLKMEISAAQANDLGVSPVAGGRTAVYVEHWDRDNFWIKVDGVQIDGGKNLWGFVPFVYIPHERVGGMWGRSMVPEAIGLVKEINARMADMGDAVHYGVNSLLLLWNLKNGYPVTQTLADGTPFVNMGRAISQGDPQPGGERLAAPTVPTGAEKFNHELLSQLRTYLMTPSISYGEEEGSQRSGQTLYQRMWPLLAHVRQERTLWTTGLSILAEYILSMLAAKHQNGISAAHLGLRKRIIWAEMVPVDREALTNEMIMRKSAGLVSTEHALERFADVEDLDDELAAIQADAKAEADLMVNTANRQQVAALTNRASANQTRKDVGTV